MEEQNIAFPEKDKEKQYNAKVEAELKAHSCMCYFLFSIFFKRYYKVII